MNEESKPRTFKTEWFDKVASKANITDSELCKAIEQVQLGQCDDLGGGVFKKRLNLNRHRSIIVAKGGRYWIYAFLFAKKDRENITQNELKDFRDLADIFANKSQQAIEIELQNKKLKEICHGKKI